jgi:hypothetical protein
MILAGVVSTSEVIIAVMFVLFMVVN